MGSDVVEEEVEGETRYIREAKRTSQFQAILAEAKEDLQQLSERTASAVNIFEPQGQIEGVRVDIYYDAAPAPNSSLLVQNPQSIQLDVYMFMAESGYADITSYITEGNILLKELRTNDNIMPNIQTQLFERDIVLDDDQFY